jgi:hypothetical protein
VWGREKKRTRFWQVSLKKKRALRKPRRRWKDNVKIEIKEIRCEVINWIDVAEDWDK